MRGAGFSAVPARFVTRRFVGGSIPRSGDRSPAFAGPSGQHSAEAANHSGQAASEGSAAVVTGAAAVVAVPIFVLGGTVAITGAALEEIGEGSAELGDDLFRAGTGQPIRTDGVTPNGPPRLD